MTYFWDRLENRYLKIFWILITFIISSIFSCTRREILSESDNSSNKEDKLNFIVIMADDLGAEEIACYGNKEHKTPNLDRLAREGVRFRTCYSTPLCSPTRVMIMTGRYGFHTGWYNFRSRAGKPKDLFPFYKIGDWELSFADVLKKKGYVSCLAGKWQLGGKPPTLIHDNGFDEYRMWAYKANLPTGVKHTGGWQKKNLTSRFWHPCILENGKYLPTHPDDYGPDLFTDFIIEFIQRHKDELFLAYYPMVLTHTPWRPTPDPDNQGKKKKEGLKSNVEYMDHLIGRIISALEEIGLRDKTVVIFTGDNGTQHAGKGLPAEIGVKVPLIISCPGMIESGVVSDELVDLTDILPTLAEFGDANLPKDRPIDGVSLVPTLLGKEVVHRDWIFSYLHERRILRTKHWLLEGDGRFYYCGDSRNRSDYVDVTNSNDTEVEKARERFNRILLNLPAPNNIEEDKKIKVRIDSYHKKYGIKVESKE
jgi:arylsulfatase A-like enzyme